MKLVISILSLAIFTSCNEPQESDETNIRSMIDTTLSFEHISKDGFNPDSILVTCVDLPDMFEYLVHDTLFNGLWYDHTKVPANWICKDYLPFLLDQVDSWQSCGGLESTLKSSSFSNNSKSTVHNESLKLMRYYLNDWTSEDEIIVDKIRAEVGG